MSNKPSEKKQYSLASMDDVPNDEKETEDKEAQKKGDKVEVMTPQQQLYYYCRQAKINEIKEIRQRVDIDGRDEEGSKANPYITFNTALHNAVLSGSLECVKVVFNLEARLNVVNKLKSTPLHLAASLGYTEIVKYLIELKADHELTNIIGNTPLHCAIYAGHVETVKIILGLYDNHQIRDALMTPLNRVGLSPVRYTKHDDMKKYLKQFFPKKNNIDGNSNDLEEEPANNNGGYNSPQKSNGGNNIEEEEDDQNESTPLTGNATATYQ